MNILINSFEENIIIIPEVVGKHANTELVEMTIHNLKYKT